MKNNNSWVGQIPNALTISRIILTFVVIYLVFIKASLVKIVIIFAIAAITDFLDGQLARRCKWESEFGRKADMIADRFLWAGTAIAFIVAFGLRGELGAKEGFQLLLMMSREIISAPFALIALVAGKPIPNARYVAKLTTLLQGFALPALILSLQYPFWNYISWPIAGSIGITGTISAIYYIKDIQGKGGEKK
ncbi:MAG: CDP-alcohol phosphatidyltransferase family protein [Nanoarchaeota archaeon]